MYFLSAIYSSCLLCLQNLEASKVFDSYNFFTIAAVVCAFIDGLLKYSLHPLASLFFFVYFGLGALSLIITLTAESDLKKEKQIILEMFNNGQLTTSADQQMLNNIDSDEMPKFQVSLQAVRVED